MTKYTLEFSHDEYCSYVSNLTWDELMGILAKVSYLSIGASITISSYQELPQ